MKIAHTPGLTVAAHRGDSYHRYENTMTAFRSALEKGADMIEFDLRLTKDGEVVIIHDELVDRTTNGTGKVGEMTLAEIRSLNAGDALHPETVPTLDEVMAWAAGTDLMLNLEIKEFYTPENEARTVLCTEKAVEALEKYGFAERAVLNSFDAWILEYIYKKYGKKYMLHGFYPYSRMKNVGMNPDEYLYCACIFADREEKLYRDLEEKGIEAWIGAGVTQESRLDLCMRYGAKLITTNNVTDVLEKLKRLGKK